MFMLMLDSITVTDVGGLVAIAAALLGGNAGLTSLLIDRKLRALNGVYVPIGECVLRTQGAQKEIRLTQEDARATCERIDELVKIIATRTAEGIMRDQEILNGIGALLARK